MEAPVLRFPGAVVVSASVVCKTEWKVQCKAHEAGRVVEGKPVKGGGAGREGGWVGRSRQAGRKVVRLAR